MVKAKETIKKNTKSKEEEKVIEKIDSPPAIKVEAEVAKAGKRSAKSIKEAEDKIQKEESKLTKAEAPKKIIKPTRSVLERRSKNYRNNYKKIDKSKTYSILEAIKTIKTTSSVKFDPAIELHVNLSVDPKLADQNIRGNLVLPGGSGKNLKVAVFSDDNEIAKKAGADIYNLEDIKNSLDKGQINFDILIASPKQMPTLAKYARLLGPRGLMPNPKSGTVTSDIEKAVKEAKGGRIEYRVDTYGIVHLSIGKLSFSEEKAFENIEAVISNIKQNKPQSIKGAYIKSMYISTTMGPSIKVDLASIS